MQSAVYQKRYSILIAVLIPVMMGPIDASVVYMALPSLSEVFGVGAGLVGWVSMSYLMVLGSFMLVLGRFGDMFGFRRIFLLGITIFTITSALCGLSQGIGMLIAFRALQAVGAGMAMALAPAIITAIFPPNERGRAMGMIGMAVGLGLAIGPSLGGVLVDTWGWRSIFFINIPIGLVAYIWCYRVLPEKEKLERQEFDWAGAFLALTALGALLFFASRGQDYGWSLPVLLVGASAILLGILFIWHENRFSQPMLDLTLFSSRVFTAGNIAALFHFITQYIIVFITPFYLQQQLGYSPSAAGIIMTAFPLTVLVTSPLSGALSDKIGNRFLSIAGALFCAAGALYLSFAGSGMAPLDIAWRLSLFGLGTGMFQAPNNSAIMGSVPKRRLGIAGGVLATVRNVGMVFGIALASAVLAARHASHLIAGNPLAYLHAMQDAYLTAAVMSLICCFACFFVSSGGVKKG